MSCSNQDKQESSEYNKTPENVVNTIFQAANTEKFTILGGLCDPFGKGDIVTKGICWLCDTIEIADSILFEFSEINGSEDRLNSNHLPIDSVKRDMKRFFARFSPMFIQMFSSGVIIGKTTYRNDVKDKPTLEFAYVPIGHISIKGLPVTDTVVLIKRNSNWYLYSI